VTSCRSIGKPLADDALQRAVGARGIVYAKRFAIRIAEIELSEIAVQMLLGAPLIYAAHAAFEDAEIALNGIGVDGIRLASREDHGVSVADILALAKRNSRVQP